MQHDWVKSTLGHGEQMCRLCFGTNRELAVLGELNYCTAASPHRDDDQNNPQSGPSKSKDAASPDAAGGPNLSQQPTT